MNSVNTMAANIYVNEVDRGNYDSQYMRFNKG